MACWSVAASTRDQVVASRRVSSFEFVKRSQCTFTIRAATAFYLSNLMLLVRTFIVTANRITILFHRFSFSAYIVNYALPNVVHPVSFSAYIVKCTLPIVNAVIIQSFRALSAGAPLWFSSRRTARGVFIVNFQLVYDKLYESEVTFNSTNRL